MRSLNKLDLNIVKTISILLLSVILAGCGGSSTPAVVNSAPTLAIISNQSMNEDTAATVTLVGSDAEGSSLTYSATSSTANVVVSVSSSTITLTPAANWNGSATITAKVNDGTVDSSAQTFTLTVSAVNDLPSIGSIPISFTKKNTAKTLTLVGTDIDSGDTLTYSATSSTSNVVPSLSGAALTLTPATNFVGNAAITIKVNDGTGDSSTQTFNLATTELTIPLLVVKIQFNTAPFNQFQSSDSTWASVIFGNGSGQLNEYMNEISNERFQFHSVAETDGTVNDGIVTASLAMPHPGQTAFWQSGAIEAAMVAIDGDVNFAAFDTNSDGIVSHGELQFLLIVAGGETATGHANAGSIWAHASSAANPPVLDAVKILDGRSPKGTYSAIGERQGGNARQMDATIGIIAHEFGHSSWLLPDLYDYDSSSSGIGAFGLMGSGSWGYKQGEPYQGQTPTHMTALMKIRSGFVTPTVISSDGTYTANDINSSSHNIFKIQSGTSGEYFLLQNRNAVGYDQGLNMLVGAEGAYAGGLLITHNSDNVSQNTNDSHRVVDIEEADNAAPNNGGHSRGTYNGLFYNGNSTTFNDSSTPNSKRVSGAASNIAITNIGNRGTAISFTVDVP
jgi:M6 family metalloprotease-like protein